MVPDPRNQTVRVKYTEGAGVKKAWRGEIGTGGVPQEEWKDLAQRHNAM